MVVRDDRPVLQAPTQLVVVFDRKTSKSGEIVGNEKHLSPSRSADQKTALWTGISFLLFLIVGASRRSTIAS
jgi:hypothetical protein